MQKTDSSAKGLTVKRIQSKQQNVIHEICFLIYLLHFSLKKKKKMDHTKEKKHAISIT